MSLPHRLAACLLSGLLLLAPPSAAALRHLQPGLQAPEFTLTSIQGERRTLGHLLGEQLTLLIFWASWSRPSEAALKQAQRLFEQYGGQGLSVIGINSEDGRGEQRKQAAAVVKGLDLRFPNLIDAGLDTFSRYGIIALPTIVILDGARIIRYELSGFPLAGAARMAALVSATFEGKRAPPKPLRQPDRKAALFFNMGNRMLWRSGPESAAAESWFLKAIAADAEFPAPHLALGRLYRARSQTERAMQHFRAALSITPENAAALCELGLLLVDNGDSRRGEALINRGIAHDGGHTPCYYYLGYAYGRRSEIRQALQLFEQAKALNRADPELYLYRARMFEANRNYSAAAASYREALQRMLQL